MSIFQAAHIELYSFILWITPHLLGTWRIIWANGGAFGHPFHVLDKPHAFVGLTSPVQGMPSSADETSSRNVDATSTPPTLL